MYGSIGHRFLWRFFYAARLLDRGGLPFRIGWECSDGAYNDFAEDSGPYECADEEMTYWSEE